MNTNQNQIQGIINLATLMLSHSLTYAKVSRTTSGVVLTSQHGKSINLVFTKQGKKKKGKRRDNGSHAALMRGALPLPARLYVRTRFNTTIQLNNTGIAYASRRYVPTYCYDVDPTVGSTAMPFFTEVMTLYRYYRTIKSKITCHFGNADGTNTTIYICPVNFDPTANTANYQNYLSNPNSKSAILGLSTGSDTKTLTHSATTDGFAGSKWLGDQDFFSGTGTTSPANNWYWQVGLYNPVNLTNGVVINITIDITFCAFEESSPST